MPRWPPNISVLNNIFSQIKINVVDNCKIVGYSNYAIAYLCNCSIVYLREVDMFNDLTYLYSESKRRDLLAEAKITRQASRLLKARKAARQSESRSGSVATAVYRWVMAAIFGAP